MAHVVFSNGGHLYPLSWIAHIFFQNFRKTPKLYPKEIKERSSDLKMQPLLQNFKFW